MSNVVDNIDAAVGIWFSSISGSLSLYQPYSAGSGSDPLGNPVNWTNYLSVGPSASGAAGATDLGDDPTSCIRFWHLTSVQIRGVLVTGNFSCCPIGSPVPVFYVCTISQGTAAGHNIGVTDGGSDTAPIDGHTIIPHGGYPVIATIKTHTVSGVDHYSAFAAGDAASLSIADCIAACGVSGYGMCAADCDNTVVNILGLS